jgi:hypothetical protein
MKDLKKLLTSYTANLLSKAIYSVELNKVKENKASRIFDTPWVRVPNVEIFNVNLSVIDPIFAYLGIKKNLPPSILVKPYKNSSINRYMVHQILRLKQAKEKNNSNLYWIMAEILMKRSNSFRVAAIQHVIKNWHRNYPLGFVLNRNRKVSKIINEGLSSVDYKRVYIPKGDKGFRPLGVPQMEWRLLLHMYSNFLTYFVQDKLLHQHAYLPLKGTLTAWKTIFEDKLFEYDYIKEWDFKGFFDSIHNNRITEILLDMKVPKRIAYFLENVNRSNIQLPEERKIDEKVHEDAQSGRKNIYWGHEDISHEMYRPLREFLNAHENHPELLRQFMAEDGCESVQEFFQLQWALFDSFKPAKIPTDFNGVAQGMPTSPILANLIMDLWIKKFEDPERVIAYADDSVSFSPNPINHQPPEDTGIQINNNKSGYVKYNGKWEKPLKFLGLEFNGEEFKAHTRKGSRLQLTEPMKLLMEAMSKIDSNYLNVEEALKYLKEREEENLNENYQGNKSSWTEYFKNRITGFIQSRLYQGKWNLDNLEQDFHMTFVNKSWLTTKLVKLNWELDVFNSSSFACYSLANMLRYNQKYRKAKPIENFVGLITLSKQRLKLIMARKERELWNELYEETRTSKDLLELQLMLQRPPTREELNKRREEYIRIHFPNYRSKDY